MNAAQENTDSQGVWEDFHGRLRSFVSRRVKQPADAEDVVQEIFLHIHRNLSTVKDEARLPAWIFKVARNAIVDYFRKNARPTEALAEDFDLPAPTEEPETDYAALNELAHCLEPMIEALPESYRHAVRLTELRGVAQSEAAKQTGSRSQASIVRRIVCPVTPLTSLITFANCTFICVSAFCIRCTHVAAPRTCSAPCLQYVRR